MTRRGRKSNFWRGGRPIARWKKRRNENAVRRLIRAGLVSRERCGRCGSRYYIELHHFYYGRLLDVEPLCRRCHYQEHARILTERFRCETTMS